MNYVGNVFILRDIFSYRRLAEVSGEKQIFNIERFNSRVITYELFE